MVFAPIRAEYEQEFDWNISIFTAKGSTRIESRVWNQRFAFWFWCCHLLALCQPHWAPIYGLKWFPKDPQAVLRSKWDVYKEPKHESLNKLAFWTVADTSGCPPNVQFLHTRFLLSISNPIFFQWSQDVLKGSLSPAPAPGLFPGSSEPITVAPFPLPWFRHGCMKQFCPMRYEVSLLSLEGSSDFSWFTKGHKEVFLFLPVNIFLSGLMLTIAAARLWWKRAWRQNQHKRRAKQKDGKALLGPLTMCHWMSQSWSSCS